MEFENIIKLIKSVSDSNLTQFTYEENGLKIELKTDKKQTLITSAPVEPKLPTTSALAKKFGNIVTSPLVGTFYAAPSPEEESFVKVGDVVSKGQVLGIVEAMKLMNEIESEFDGVVKEIMVSNEEVVEFDQPMFVIQDK